MLVLSYPKKNILFLLAVTIAACLLTPGAAKAQAQSAIINPDGGNTSTDGLRITITDTAILVKRNGLEQYNLSDTIPPHDRGLKTYVILQQKSGTNSIKQPTYLTACDISGVHGEGTIADPWKVTTLTTLNNATGGIYNLTTVYSYVNGNDYYLVDFYISAHERFLTASGTGGPYYMHIYFSERSWLNNSDIAGAVADDWVSCETDDYFDDEVAFGTLPPAVPAWNLPQLVGAECGSGDCPDGFTGGHYFKTKGGFTSYKVGAPQGRDTKVSPGYELESQVTSVIQSMGVAVHKTVEIEASNAGKTRSATKRFIIGFDRAEIAALDLPEPPLVLSENHGQTTSTDSSKVTIELSGATSSGMEGEISHPLEGLALTVSGGMFNAPQIAYLRVVTTGTGTGHAAPGTDYEVLYTHVVIPAESYFAPVQIPLNNILINGDAIENPDKTLTVELLPTCSPYLKLGSITSSDYTIIDDDEHKIYVEAAQPTLDEGQSMKVKVRMTGELLPTPVTVTLSKGGTSEAEDEDHSPLPPTVTIPAGELEVEFDLDAAPDRILEPEETLEINATATFGIETKTAADTIRIIDTTQNNAANKVIHFITQNAPENTPVTFTASLPTGVSTELPLEITMPANLSSGSVASSSDFNTIFPATVTIGAFESSVDFTVTAASDNRIEPDEIAYFDATATGFTVQQGSFYVIDNQANKQITISFDLSEVSEGNTVTGTVHLPYLTTYALELDLLKDPASVADDDDFGFQNTKVTFAVLANEATFELDINSDLLLELDELLKIGGTYKDFTVVPGTVTIKDETKNQPGLCEFTIEPQAVNVLEGNNVNVKVKLAPGVQSTQAITINLNNGGGGTADAADYSMPSSVTIDPGDNEATFVLTAAPDMIIEPAEQLQIAGNATIFGYSSTQYETIDILDATGNDPDNKKIAVNTPLSVTEGSSLPVTFSLPAGITTTDPITIDIAITQVGAGYGENLDFVGGVPPSLVIPAGGNNVTWTAVPATDGVTEGTEHLVLQATTSTGFTVNDNNPVDVEVLDNTSASPATTIEFSTSLSTLSEEGFDIAEITVSLQSGTASSPIIITLDKLAGSTATDDDFAFFPEEIIIGTGESSFTFYMAANADFLLERREVLNLSGIAAGYTFVGTTLYFDDATSKNISLVLDDPSMAQLVEENSTLRLRVKLDDGVLASENMTVNLSRGAGSVASLLATEYAFPASVVIPAGVNYVAFDVEAKPDGVIEPTDERLELIATADIFGDTRTSAMDVDIVDVTGTIPANKVVTVSGPATVTEGSTVNYTFSLPSGITSAEDIIINLTAATVTPATVAADFNPAIPPTVTIPAGADHVTLTIKAANDNIIEATEKLQLNPSSTGFTFSGNVSLDVIDNSITGAAIGITSSDANLTEGENATITAALQGGLVAGVDIVVTISAGTASTADVADHATLVNITIPAESSSGTMTFTTLEDDFLEAAETLVIEGAATGFTVTGTTVTIDDKNGQDAANKTFTVTPEATSVTEGGGTKVWIRLPSPQKTQEALTINLQRGLATSAGLLASEYNFVPAVTIPAGGSEVSFDLDIMTDNVIEAVEELEIEASAMVYGTSITASNKVDIVDANDRTITISGPAIVTEGSSATLTFSLPSGITTAEAITINLAPGTATPATDAADFSPALLTSVTIPAGGDHVDFPVKPATDGILEPTEKLHLIPSATGFTFGSDVTLDILDNDHTGATIALSTSQTSIAEGGAGTTITATLLGGLTAGTDIVINLSRGSSSTSQSSDHSTLTPITIAATHTSGSTTLTATEDNILERNETLILEGTATGFTVTGTTVTITDATGPKQLTLTPEATTVTEGNTIKVWVRLPSGITTSEAIPVQLAAGTSTVAGSTEYTFPPTVTIPANGSEVSFDLTATPDNVIEPNELLEITAEADVSDVDVTANTSVNIIDATGNKTITITGPADVTEGGAATLTFSLPTGITTAEAITINLVPGTATPATDAADFSPALLTSVTIPAGGDHVDFPVNPSTDNILEPTEKLHLIPSATGFTFGSDVTLDILDNDHTGATIALSTSQTSIAEGGTGTTITATLLGGLTAGTDIVINLSRGSSSTSQNTDHSTLNQITVAATHTSGSTTISAEDDDILERNETIVLEGTATGFTVTGTTVTITDATGPKQLTLTPEATTVTEGNTIKVWVRLPSGITTSEAIPVQLAAGTSTVAGSTEYTFPPTVTIPANSNEVSFDLTATTDNVIEPNELLEITAEADVFDVDATTNATVNIVDATGTTTNKVISITGPTTVTEGNSATLTFSLPSGITTAEAITINLAPGTATPATDAADFSPALLTSVTIPAGSDHVDFPVNPATDAILEPTEKLHLIPSATGFTFGSDVTLDIVDNDHTGATIALSTSQTSIAEGGAGTTITATLLGGLTAGTDIVINLSRGSSSTSQSTDHSTLNQITIAATHTSGSTTLTATEDNILERNETLILEGTATGLTVTGTTVTITDATGPKQLTLTPEATTVTEGNTIKVWVRLPSGITTSEAIPVQLAAGTSTEAGSTEYTFLPTVTIPANSNEVSFDLTATPDNVIEPNELLEIAAEANVFDVDVTANTSVNIIDATGNKTITITGPADVTEGSSTTLTFSLPTGITTAEAITINLASGTATPATDAADFSPALLTSVTIPAGSDHVDFPVNPTIDGILEPTEKLHLIPSATGFTFGSDVTLDIVDNDHTGATIALSTSQATIAEGGTGTTITATLLGGLTAGTDIVINLSRGSSSTSQSTDHSTLSQITIAATHTSGSTTLTATVDNILERSETIELEGTATGFTVTGTTVTITDATGPKQIILTPEATTVTEGNTIKVWIRLPTGITTSEAIPVQLAAGTSTVAGSTEYSFLPTVTIPANGNEVSFDLTATPDNVIEPNELLEITAEADVFDVDATANTTVNIVDATGTTTNKVISITGATTVTEGSSTTLTFSLPSGITTAEAITINLAPGTATPTTTAADFSPALLTSVTIPAGSDHVDFPVNPATDAILEPTEKLHLIPSATGFTFGSDVTLDILDNDHTGATIALSTSQTTIAEGGTGTTITATLLGGLTAGTDIVINLSRGSSSTSQSTDHSTLNQITIAATHTSGSTTLTATEDNILERNETIVLEGTATGFTVTGTTVTITDATGPKQISVTPEATTVTEGSTIKVWVRLPTGITTSEAIPVQLAAGTSTVAGSTEYTFLPTVTIPANSNEVSFDLTATPDNVIEPNELLEITAEADVFDVDVTANAIVNIIDATGNKTITITGPADVTEGNSATITFSLPTGITTAEAIIITLAPGTSTVDASDINGGIPVQAIIPAGNNAGTLEIDINTDGVIEPAEVLHLLPSATGFTFSGDLHLNVLDENHSGTLTITAPATITEGNSATITVSLPGALLAGSDIEVNLNRGAASTAAVTDHSAIPPTVTIKTGEHAASFTVTASTDNILEITESLVIGGTAAAYSVNAATLQIEDATGADPANTVITLQPATSDILEGTTAQFRVSLPAGIVSSTPIQVNMSKTVATSTAADTDHTQIPSDITIPAMSNVSADFNISAVTDGIIEPQEMLIVDGSAPAGLSFAGTVIHINDATGLNPANREITVTIDSTILHEGNTSKMIFSLPAGITTATAISITVTPGADYAITPAAIVIAAGENKAEVTLEAVQDNSEEATEVINLTATATGFTVLPAPAVTIPGDAAPALSLTLVKTTDAAEPSTNGLFTIQLDNSATAPADITIYYTTAATATAGTDYTALSGQAVIKNGENSVTIPVTVLDDQLVEGAEELQLTLQSASYEFLGNPVACAVNNSSVSMTIADNAGYDLSLRIDKIADAAEPNTNGTAKVRFNSNITAIAPVTVSYTIAGTATTGTDYTALSGTLTIPAGKQEALITIIPLDDHVQEGDETVVITLTGASSTIPGVSWSLAAQPEATITLEDDDVVTMEVFAADEIAEGSVLPVTLRASQTSPIDIPVTVTLQHDAARTVNPTVPQSGTTLTVILPANQTEVSFNIGLEDNETNDDDGFVNLLIEPQTGGGQPYGKGASGNTATRIVDNDPLEITFKKDTIRVMEGHSGTTPMPFTVVLSRRSTRAITLHYEFGDAFEGAGADKDPQRAHPGEDYHALITSIVIPLLEDEADIVVPVFGDVGAEEDEYFALKLRSAVVTSGQNLPVMGVRKIAVGGIMNDDMAIDMEIRVSKALSPNGDGRNDVLLIENIEKYPRNEIVILNRWGGTIFKTSNYNNQSNNFNGRSNAGGGSGNDLPDGSYFYILHVWDGNGKMQRHTGYIVLKHAN